MIVGLLLAAGDGRRFGGDKLLAPLNGVPIAAHSARALQVATDRSVAIVRPQDAALQGVLETEGMEVVVCAQAHGGMGFSIACGVAATADAAGWIVALGDMPFVRPQTIARLVQKLREGAPLVAPFYQAQRGHPVGFGATFAAALEGLRGDQGARCLLQAHIQELIRMPCEDPGVLRDIDRRSDLEHSA
ncbi:MAG TPA: nucleotidyltransferase family protein [Acidiferrobacteraceae bacterium]|nr:nucleotidyltransferase family protein [Acidiferrobacteraceae bacterium]